MHWNERKDQTWLHRGLRKIRRRFHRSQRILFSPRPEWEDAIRIGFRPTRHEIVFGEISAESMADFDLVVPLSITCLKRMDAFRESLARNAIPLPSLESILLCDDKLRFNRTLIELGFGDHVPTMGGPHGYPYILKKRIGEWSRECHIITDAAAALEQAPLLAHPDYFTQEMIAGHTEYATHIVVRNGRIAGSLNIRYGFAGGFPIKGHEPAMELNACECPHLGFFERLLNAIGFEGLCCVNYKERHGRPMLLEINPRFGGSLGPYFAGFIEDME